MLADLFYWAILLCLLGAFALETYLLIWVMKQDELDTIPLLGLVVALILTGLLIGGIGERTFC